VTVLLKKDIESDWLRWMNEVHIPDVMNTGYFFDWQIHKQLLPENSIDEITYMINYFTRSLDLYQLYTEKEAPRLQNEHNQKFKDKYIASRTVYSLIPK